MTTDVFTMLAWWGRPRTPTRFPDRPVRYDNAGSGCGPPGPDSGPQHGDEGKGKERDACQEGLARPPAAQQS